MAQTAGEGSPPRALLFDVGRVVVRVDVRRAVAPLSATAKLDPADVWRAIENDPRWRHWQEGRIEPSAWHKHLDKRFGVSMSFEEFCRAWNSALDPATILPAAMFRELAGRCKLALLSNTDPIHVAYLERSYEFVRYFPVRVFSCQLGVSKPNPAIYRHAIRELGVRPEEILYIDDVAEYVKSGRRLGMLGHHFVGPEALMEDLRTRGLGRNSCESTSGG